jgi:hypothetical protein
MRYDFNVYERNARIGKKPRGTTMRHLVYAIKVIVNEDLKAQDRRRMKRTLRDRAAEPTVTQTDVRRRPSVEPATRTSDVAPTRRAANAGA